MASNSGHKPLVGWRAGSVCGAAASAGGNHRGCSHSTDPTETQRAGRLHLRGSPSTGKTITRGKGGEKDCGARPCTPPWLYFLFFLILVNANK